MNFLFLSLIYMAIFYTKCSLDSSVIRKNFTASYGDLHYAEKREHYLKQNLLACSLHERTYDRNPSFRRFIEESGLPFRAHAEFKKEVLDTRQDLYRRLARRIWEPERLAREAAS